MWVLCIIKEWKVKKIPEHDAKQQAFLLFPSLFSVNTGRHNFFLGNNKMVGVLEWSKKLKNK